MTAKGVNGDDNVSSSEYDDLILVEDLESLLEELDEAGVAGTFDLTTLPPDLRERLESAGLASVDELRARIRGLHRRLDDTQSAN